MVDSGSTIEPGKLFVGGISWDTTADGMKAYFEKFGEVADCVVMKDSTTSRPRGFGFVKFKEPSCVNLVLAQSAHMLDNKKIDPKPATMKVHGSLSLPPSGELQRVKKIFVGGIAPGTTDDDIRQYFMQFGLVTEVDLKIDKNTNKCRGFGFVGFESEEVVDKVCSEHFHTINGKKVETKKAEPRYASSGAGYSGYHQHNHQTSGYMQGALQNGFGNQYRGAPSSYGGGYGGYGYGQQQQQYGNYAAYGTGYNQGSSYGQQGYTGYTGYDGFQAPQRQMGSYPQDSSGYGAASGRSTYSSGTDYSSTAAAAAAGYGYGDSTSYAGYQDQSAATGYGRGSSQQRTGFAPYQQHHHHQ